VVILLLLLWKLAWGLLLVFAGALLAAGLTGLSERVRDVTGLPAGWSLLLVTLLLLGVLGFAGWFLTADLATEFRHLDRGVAAGMERVHEYLGQYPRLRQLVEEPMKPADLLASTNGLLWGVTSLFSTVLNGVIGCIVLFVLGFYLAAEPGVYQRGFLRLLPARLRHQGQEVINAVAGTLRWWLLGQFVYMAVIGIGVGVGLWLLGVRSPLALGLLSFLLAFVPFFGAITAAIPAVLMGLTISPLMAMNVVLLFVGVHLVESYVVFPLVQKISVKLPPALTVSAQVLFGLLFGVLGVVLATPLVAAGLVLVQKLYLEGVLGEAPEGAPELVPGGAPIPAALQPQKEITL
jgi:predicted PurR-regulated permease PerM